MSIADLEKDIVSLNISLVIEKTKLCSINEKINIFKSINNEENVNICLQERELQIEIINNIISQINEINKISEEIWQKKYKDCRYPNRYNDYNKYRIYRELNKEIKKDYHKILTKR